MKIKNGEIDKFSDFLMSMELIGRKSRLRTRFVKKLLERSNLVKEEHMELISQFAKFDEKGEPIIIELNGQQVYDIPDRTSFNKEYLLLMNEEYVVEENEENKEMLLLLKDIILNCEKTFSGREAVEYDRWCEIVEEVNYDE